MISRSPASFFIKKVKLDSEREFNFQKKPDSTLRDAKTLSQLEASNSIIGNQLTIFKSL